MSGKSVKLDNLLYFWKTNCGGLTRIQCMYVELKGKNSQFVLSKQNGLMADKIKGICLSLLYSLSLFPML